MRMCFQKIRYIFWFLVIVVFIFDGSSPPANAHTSYHEQLQQDEIPDMLISNYAFENANSMTLDEIMSFLSEQQPSLGDFMINGDLFAQFIYQAATQETGVNPQVILILIEVQTHILSSERTPEMEQNAVAYINKLVHSFNAAMQEGGTLGEWLYPNDALTLKESIVIHPQNFATAMLYSLHPYPEFGKQFEETWKYYFGETEKFDENIRSVNLLDSLPVATRFSYPMGDPSGSDYKITQEFYVWSSRVNKYHAGEDWTQVGYNTAGHSVYAVADGKVLYRKDCGYPGGNLLIQHALPDNSYVYSHYGHIDPDPSVVMGTLVQRGQKIGTIWSWDQSGGVRNSHLHFEIRTEEFGYGGTWYGSGYGNDDPRDHGYLDPTGFIAQHSLSLPIGIHVINTSSLNVYSEPRSDANVIATLSQGAVRTVVDRQIQTRDPENTDGSVWYKIRYDLENSSLMGWIVGINFTKQNNGLLGSTLYVSELFDCPQFTEVTENGVDWQYFIFYKDPEFMCNNEGAYKGYVRWAVLKPVPNPDFVYHLPDSFGASSVRIPSGHCIMMYDENGTALVRRCCSDRSFVDDKTYFGLDLNDNVDTFKWIDFPPGGYCSVGASSINATTNCLPNQAPDIPTLIQPSNNYVALRYVAPTLCWHNKGDLDGDEVEFNVNVYNDTTNLTSSWISNACWRPSQLDYQYGSYQWRVQARDAGNATSDWSETWNFSIASPNRPPSIDFNAANGNNFPSGIISSHDSNWTFSGTASDPEGALSRIEFRCSGDNCGSHYAQTGLGAWSNERHGLSGQNDIYFTAFDEAGNYNYSRHLDLRIDLAAPTTRVSLNSETSASQWPTWFRLPVEVHLTAIDGSTGRARVGVQEIRYRVDGSAWQTQNGETTVFTLSNDGVHTIEYYAVDKVGNIESTRSVSFQVDQTPPSIPSGIVETHEVAHDVWQKGQNAPTFIWNASNDTTSGMWGYQFYFGKDAEGIGYQTFKASDSRQWTPQPGGVHTGVYYLRGRSRDNAGNWSAWTNLFTFRYDETPPENPGEVTHTAGITNTVWQRETNVADFSWVIPHDEGSGVRGYYVYWGLDSEGTTSDFITSHSFQNSVPLCAVDAACTGYLRLRSVDNVDNAANEWSTGFVLRYDNVPPTVDFTFNSGITITDQPLITLNITGIDEGSGVKAMRFSADGQDWLPWEVYTSTHVWALPAISRQFWPVYVQVIDGVDLLSPVISHTIYLDVNRLQPRSANFRLFDHILSAGAGSYASTTYTGRATVGQLSDMAIVSSTNYQIALGYEAGSQTFPLIVPGHDEYVYLNGIFASGTGATTLSSTNFAMLGTFNELGLPTNVTTLASATFTHQPGFLAAAPSIRAQELPTQTIGPPPPAAPKLLCETPYVHINGDAAFTNQLTVTLDLCAPHAAEMQLSNTPTLISAIWEPYTTTRTWVISDTDPQTTARFVYVVFKDEDGKIQDTYFDDIIYDTSIPTLTVLLEAEIPVDLTQLSGQTFAKAADSEVTYMFPEGSKLSSPVPLIAVNEAGGVPVYVGGTDANSGLTEMQLSGDPTFTDLMWEPYVPAKLYVPSGEDGLKTVYARGRDAAGNISSIVTGTFLYDTQSPVGDITFNTLAVRPDVVTTTLYLDAWDNESGVSDMRIGTNPLLTDAAWEPYTDTVVMPLSLSARIPITIYAQYRDLSGNLSAIYSDILSVDDEPPVIYVAVSSDNLTDTGTITLPVRTLTIYAYDDLSGIVNRYVSNDPLMSDGVVTLPYTSTIAWTFDETHVAWVQAEDSVGNVSAPYPVYVSELVSPSSIYLPLVIRNSISSATSFP